MMSLFDILYGGIFMIRMNGNGRISEVAGPT